MTKMWVNYAKLLKQQADAPNASFTEKTAMGTGALVLHKAY